MNRKKIPFLYCALVHLAALCGSFFSPVTCAQEPTKQEMMSSMDHEHTMIAIPESKLLPQLGLILHRDSKSGFNLTISAQDFELEPPENKNCCESTGSPILEGHAHIFVNGKKVYRAYAKYIHLPADLFQTGVNQVMVSLNDHDHNTWSIGAKMAMSTLVIDTTKEDFLLHRFESQLSR